MQTKLTATEITKNFWIVKDGKEKCGVLSLREDNGTEHYRYSATQGASTIEYLPADIADHFEFTGKTDESSWHDQTVFGYPVIKVETFQIREIDELPCFSKTVSSSVFFAAGWYSINFDNGGWMESFCPKLGTLRKYEYMGPFKTESDMQLSIQRKKRTE